MYRRYYRRYMKSNLFHLSYSTNVFSVLLNALYLDEFVTCAALFERYLKGAI